MTQRTFFTAISAFSRPTVVRNSATASSYSEQNEFTKKSVKTSMVIIIDGIMNNLKHFIFRHVTRVKVTPVTFTRVTPMT